MICFCATTHCIRSVLQKKHIQNCRPERKNVIKMLPACCSIQAQVLHLHTRSSYPDPLARPQSEMFMLRARIQARAAGGLRAGKSDHQLGGKGKHFKKEAAN